MTTKSQPIDHKLLSHLKTHGNGVKSTGHLLLLVIWWVRQIQNPVTIESVYTILQSISENVSCHAHLNIDMSELTLLTRHTPLLEGLLDSMILLDNAVISKSNTH